MKRTTNGYRIVLGTLFCCMLFSCKKEEVPTMENLIAYTGGGNAAYNVINGGSFTLIRSTVLSGQHTAFPVLLTRPFTQDVQVTAQIDTNFLATYDSTYNVTSPRLPDGAFVLEDSGTVRISAGTAQSVDSIRIRLADLAKLSPGTTDFVIPVVLTSATASVPISTNRQVMFVRVAINSIVSGVATFTSGNLESIVLQQVDGETSGTDEINFAAVLNKPIAKAVPVSVAENTAAIAAFNAENGTDFQHFPTGSYQLVNAQATIDANETQSADSIRVKLTDLSLFAPGTDYLLALKVVDNPAEDMPPTDETRDVVYVHVNVFVNNIDPANGRLTGTPIFRTEWSVTASSVYSTGFPSNMLDGDNGTAWNSNSGRTHEMVLDMGAARQVKGFLLTPNYVYRSENITKMNVYSSNNGTVWNLEGQYSGSAPGGSATEPDIKTVRFNSPVNARYFRFEILESNGQAYTGIGELNAIE